MNIKHILKTALNVVLRVPSLLYLEIIYRNETSNKMVALESVAKDVINAGNIIFIKELYNHNHQPQDIEYYDLIFFKYVFKPTVFILFFLIAFLHYSKVIRIYLNIASGIILYLAAFLSRDFVLRSMTVALNNRTRTATEEDIWTSCAIFCDCGFNIILQVLAAATVSHILTFSAFGKMILMSFSLPMLAKLLSFPASHLYVIHNFCAYFLLMMIVFYLVNQSSVLVYNLKGLYVEGRAIGINFGWLEVPIHMWGIYRMSEQLLVYWLCLFSANLYRIMYLDERDGANMEDRGTFYVLLRCVSESCMSPLSMMALCITVSYASFAVLTLTKFYLQGQAGLRNENILHRGWAEGITMLLVALQVDITDMKTTNRTNLMIIVMFIILSSLLESMHEIVGPHLLQLGASQGSHFTRHFNALLMAAVLHLLPLYMASFIMRRFETDFWLLIIVSSCLLTTIQVTSTLVIYVLFIYDQLRAEPYNQLDDVIFYIKSFVRILEFLVALVVVTFGLKESIFGQWSMMSACVLMIHFYFNVWQRMQAGWKSYLLRRNAIKRLQSLPEATQVELDQLNDVCAICFADMQSSGARRTVCNHFFHALCLRKWLYVKDTCPMCQQKIAEDESEDSSSGENNANVRDEAQDEVNHQMQDFWEEVSTSESSVFDDEDIDLGVYFDDADHLRTADSDLELEGEEERQTLDCSDLDGERDLSDRDSGDMY